MRGRLIKLILSPENRRQAVIIEFYGDFGEQYDKLSGRDIEVVIKPYRAKRSLDANAYAWTLIDRLAAEMSLTKEEVYRAAIKKISGVSETVCVQQKAVDKLCEVWTGNGLGWQCEQFPSKIPGCVNVTLYYGSSVYDTAQMSRLIDQLIQDCNALGIETKSPEELNALLNEWERGTSEK